MGLGPCLLEPIYKGEVVWTGKSAWYRPRLDDITRVYWNIPFQYYDVCARVLAQSVHLELIGLVDLDPRVIAEL